MSTNRRGKVCPVLKIFQFFLPPTVITLVAPDKPTADDIQRATYELIRERVLDTLGPTGSFAVTIRKGDEVDEFFSEALAESIARDVARSLRARGTTHRAGPRTVPAVAAARPDLSELEAPRPAVPEFSTPQLERPATPSSPSSEVAVVESDRSLEAVGTSA